jgi:hypothetical protein
MLQRRSSQRRSLGYPRPASLPVGAVPFQAPTRGLDLPLADPGLCPVRELALADEAAQRPLPAGGVETFGSRSAGHRSELTAEAVTSLMANSADGILRPDFKWTAYDRHLAVTRLTLRVGYRSGRGMVESDADDQATTDRWPGSTLIVRGGSLTSDDLAKKVDEHGCWSTSAEPGLALEELAVYIRHGKVRTTTVDALRHAGGTLLATRGPKLPPFHADACNISAVEFDKILGEAQANPVDISERWKGES